MLDALPFREVWAVDFEFAVGAGAVPIRFVWSPGNCGAVASFDYGAMSSALPRRTAPGRTLSSLRITRAPRLAVT